MPCPLLWDAPAKPGAADHRQKKERKEKDKTVSDEGKPGMGFGEPCLAEGFSPLMGFPHIRFETLP